MITDREFILRCGLGQYLAVSRVPWKRPTLQAVEQLESYLTEKFLSGSGDLLEEVRKRDTQFLIELTGAALTYLEQQEAQNG